MITSHNLETAARCPTCSKQMDGATNAGPESARPNPGDLGICAYCTTLLVYTEGLGVREVTPSDLAGLDRETRLRLEHVRRRMQQRGGLSPLRSAR